MNYLVEFEFQILKNPKDSWVTIRCWNTYAASEEEAHIIHKKYIDMQRYHDVAAVSRIKMALSKIVEIDSYTLYI